MNAEIWEAAVLLPSVRRFLNGIVQDLKGGRSVVVLLPPGIPPELIWASIRARLYERDLMCEVIDAVDFVASARSVDPVAIARTVIGERVTPRMPFRDAMAIADCPEVIGIVGVSSVDTVKQREMLNAVRRWADETIAVGRAETSTRKHALCVVDSASALLPYIPANSPGLVSRWWWGFPSALELRLLYRELAAECGAGEAWLECLVAGIAPGDLALSEIIWQGCPRDIGETRELLVQARGLLAILEPAGNTLRAPGAILLSMEPPAGLRLDWAAGRVVSSFEYGTEAHPVILASGGEQAELEHRMWRGQAQLLLPLADSVRLAASRYAVQRYGLTWYLSAGCLPEDPEHRSRLEANALDAELGYLLTALRRLNGGPERFDWIHRVDTARDVRNSLAHYTPVPQSQFKSFLSTVDGIPRQLMA